jgi:hypothetical protein
MKSAVVPRLLFWSPRLLSIVFALFLSVFALDVFREGQGFWPTALALFMHLIPALLVAAVLAVAWRHELFGAVVFGLLGLLYILWAWGRFHWSAYAVISGGLFAVGLLFLFDHLLRRRPAPPAEAAR